MQKKTAIKDPSCLELWGIPLLAKDWQKKLETARKTPGMVQAMLARLPAPEARALDLLYHNGPVQPRSWLGSKMQISRDELDLLLNRLVALGIVLLSRNRSRLDDSADRIELHSDIRTSIQSENLVVAVQKKLSILYPQWDGAGPRHLATEYALSCAGVLPLGLDPENLMVPPDTTCFYQSMLLMDQGYVPVHVLREDPESDSDQENRGGRDRLDGIAVLAKIIRHTMRVRMRACEGVMPGKREITAWAESCGYQGETVRMLFSWLAMNGWLMDDQGTLNPARQARTWLASGLKERIDTIREMARARIFKNVPGRKSIKWENLHQAAVQPRQLSSEQDWIEACLATRKALDEVTIFWLLGALSVQLNAGALHKIDLAELDNALGHKPGPLVVTGDMTIVIPEIEASPHQILLFSAFCRVERDSGMIRAKVTEKNFLDGLAAGFDGLEFLRMLEACSRQALPQNIVFTITDWIENTIQAVLHIKPVLHMEENRLDELMHDPAFVKLVDRRVGPNDIILDETDEREIGTILQRHGIILDCIPDNRHSGDGMRA